MKKILSILLVLVLIIVLVLSGIQIYKNTREKSAEQEEQYLIPVVVTSVRTGDLYDQIEYIGEINPNKVVNVFPKVSGKVIKNNVSEGDLVKQGRILTVIDRDITGFKYKNATVEAPLTGFIVVVHADEGNMVHPQSPIYTIYDMEKVKITFLIPEKNFVPDIKDKQIHVEVPSANFNRQDLRITKVYPTLDPVTRSFKVEISLDNPDHSLKPGSYARINLIFRKSLGALTIPKDAIFEFEGKKYVYKVVDNTISRVEIKTGIQDNLLFEVVEGLQPGDKIVYKGIYSIKEGDKVMVVREERVEQ